jgi:GNAT superfamily N-acetyltransferase
LSAVAGRPASLVAAGRLNDTRGSTVGRQMGGSIHLSRSWHAGQPCVLRTAGNVRVRPLALDDASVVVQDDAHRFLPLLAFVVTDPEYQRQGLGQRLIQETIPRLDAAGIHELHLAVRSDNPALRLYRRLGFHEQAVPDDHS